MKYFSPAEIFNRDTSFRFRVGKVRLHGPLEKHRHLFFCEMIVIVEGQGIHMVNDTRYLVSAGDVFMLKGENAHSFENCQNMVIVNIMFDLGLLGDVISRLKKMPGFISFFDLEPIFRGEHDFKSRLTMNRPQLDRAFEFIEILLHEFKHRPTGYEAALTGTLIDLLVYISRLYEGSEKPHTDELIRIARAIHYIDHHYRIDISVPHLAGLANLSVNQFHRVFHAATGTSPIDYVNRRRIADAKESLLATDVPITRLAFDLGFSDSNYFSRVFKKYVGTSPTGFRRRLL
jgi:AraC family L-rhamnose operon transcriptional activator RhaR/AraC family L-rhamnose operon regulatory protein RhaS